MLGTVHIPGGPPGAVARRSESPIAGGQMVNAVVTDLVLRSDITMMTYPGDILMPRHQVSGWKWVHYINGAVPEGGPKQAQQIKRGYGARVLTGRMAEGKVEGELVSRSFAMPVDTRQVLFNTSGVDKVNVASLLSVQTVRLSLEEDRAAMVADTGNYGTVVTVPAGSGWNQPAGAKQMKADVAAAAKAIENATGIPKEALTLTLFGNARHAVLENDDLIARVNNAANGTEAEPTYPQAARYFGIKEVLSGGVALRPDGTRMYGDVAVLSYQGGPELSSGLGGKVWARTMCYGSGAVLGPWYEADRTSWLYGFEDHSQPHVVLPECGVLIVDAYQ